MYTAYVCTLQIVCASSGGVCLHHLLCIQMICVLYFVYISWWSVYALYNVCIYSDGVCALYFVYCIMCVYICVVTVCMCTLYCVYALYIVCASRDDVYVLHIVRGGVRVHCIWCVYTVHIACTLYPEYCIVCQCVRALVVCCSSCFHVVRVGEMRVELVGGRERRKENGGGGVTLFMEAVRK